MLLPLYFIFKVIFKKNNLQNSGEKNSGELQIKSNYNILWCKTNENSGQLVKYMGRSKINKNKIPSWYIGVMLRVVLTL